MNDIWIKKDFLPGIFFIEGFWEKIFIHIDRVGIIPDCEPGILNPTQDVGGVIPGQALHH